MKIIFSDQVESVIWPSDASSYFLAAAGFESRARFAAETLLNANVVCERRVFGFAERKLLARTANEDAFNKLGFMLMDDVAAKDGAPLGNYVREVIANSLKREITIANDYSCMTKTWYAEIIRVLSECSKAGCVVHIYFIYSPAKYTPPGPPGTNRVAGAISGFCHLASPTFPTALILGLGYEAVRAMGLRDYVDPKATFAFFTNPGLEPIFTQTVMKNNRAIISTLAKDSKFPYPMADLNYTSALLANLTRSLKDQFRVIIAPLGPKPFCLLSLLLSAETRYVDVWRVSGAEHSVAEERAPFGRLLIYKVSYAT